MSWTLAPKHMPTYAIHLYCFELDKDKNSVAMEDVPGFASITDASHRKLLQQMMRGTLFGKHNIRRSLLNNATGRDSSRRAQSQPVRAAAAAAVRSTAGLAGGPSERRKATRSPASSTAGKKVATAKQRTPSAQKNK